jgi:hypothetical protein
MTYFMIFTRDAVGSDWAPQFGDSDQECVRQEREDSYLRQPGCGYPDDGKFKASDIKIVRFARMPSAAQVDAKAAELNA